MSSGSVVQRAADLTFSLPQYEARSRLQQLSGSSAISSSDLFGDVDGTHGAGGPGAGAGTRRACWPSGRALGAGKGFLCALGHPLPPLTGSVSLGNVLPTADIAQFKQGVKSVAGKMAVLANGVMNSLQVRLDRVTWGGRRLEGSAEKAAFSTTSRLSCRVASARKGAFSLLGGQLPSSKLGPGAGPLPEMVSCLH